MILISITSHRLSFIGSSEKNGSGHGKTKRMSFSELAIRSKCIAMYIVAGEERFYLIRCLSEISPILQPLLPHPPKITQTHPLSMSCLLFYKELG
jgi:hypothetical protein